MNRALIALLLATPAGAADVGWRLELPDSPAPCRTWLGTAGWEEQRGSASAWVAGGGQLLKIGRAHV